MKKHTAMNGYADQQQKRLVDCSVCDDGDLLTKLEHCLNCGKKGRLIVDVPGRE